MKYISLYTLLLFSGLELSNSYPFDESKCIECKKIIGKIKNNTNSINNYYSQLVKNPDLLKKNTTYICERLELCDRLKPKNKILELYDNISIYRYYNKIIALKEDIINNLINYNKVWSIIINEPYKFITLLNVYYPRGLWPNDYSYSDCSYCGTDYYNIIKLNTQNFLYYLNRTDGSILYKKYIPNLENIIINDLSISDRQENKTYDTLYNGSIYNIITEYKYIPSVCYIKKYTNINHCMYTDIENINIKKYNINYPNI